MALHFDDVGPMCRLWPGPQYLTLMQRSARIHHRHDLEMLADVRGSGIFDAKSNVSRGKATTLLRKHSAAANQGSEVGPCISKKK